MRTLHDKIRVQVAKKILSIADPDTGSALEQQQQDLLSSKIREMIGQLVEPPNADLGDLAFGCFILAKQFKKSPAILAQELAAAFEVLIHDKKENSILKAQAAGPYLNLTLSPQWIGELLLTDVVSQDFFKMKLIEDPEKTMIEFSQPNTHKELHVGHMRNACLGDSLVRLHRYAGFELVSSTFPGDVGTHVAKCLWYLKYHNQEPIPETGRGEWLGGIYTKANLKLEDDEKSDLAAKNQSEMTEILKQLESGSGAYFDLWKETRQWSIDLMKQVYAWSGIEFDQWYWESDVDSASVKYIKELLADGKLIVSEGAVGMNLEAENLGFCLLLKRDGTGLYATKDIELARRKFQDFHIEKSIYVVDMRQELHFKQVFKVLEKLGFEQAKKCFHLKYNFVELPDGAMSSRKGNIVPLMKLVHAMEKMVKEQYLNRYANEWSSEEIEKIASQVAQGAIKYGMLRMDTNKKIVFDMAEWLKLDGESGPFIQYSSARIQSVLRKFNLSATGPQKDPPKDPPKVNWGLLVHPSEKRLMQSMMGFHSIVLGATENYKPHLLCTYLYELAKRFNHFYHECSIGQADSEELKLARLALSQAVGLVLKNGLGLLGIPSPERM